MKKRSSVLVLAALLAFLPAQTALAGAQDAPAKTGAAKTGAAKTGAAKAGPRHTAPEDIHPELKKFSEQGGSIEFIGHSHGLDGWLITLQGQPPRTVYTTREGGLVIGQMVSPDGIVQTANQLLALEEKVSGGQDAVPGADNPDSAATAAERFYAEVEKAGWVEVGRADAPFIYLFFNTTCPECQSYWKELQPDIEAGRIRVRLAPYGAAAANRDGGAALLASADPAQAWNDFIAGKTQALARTKAAEAKLAAVDANGALLKKWNIQKTPFTIYRRPGDGRVAVILGQPQNMLLLRAELLKPN